jgi:hypothetical protein
LHETATRKKGKIAYSRQRKLKSSEENYISDAPLLNPTFCFSFTIMPQGYAMLCQRLQRNNEIEKILRKLFGYLKKNQTSYGGGQVSS